MGLAAFAFELRAPAAEFRPVPGAAGYSFVDVPGWVRSSTVGEPDVPFRVFRIAIPPDAVPRLQVRVLEHSFRGGDLPAPVPEIRYESGDDVASDDVEALERRRDLRGETVYRVDFETYHRERWTVASLGRIGTFRGQRFVEVRFAPFGADLVAGGLQIAERVAIEIDFGGSSGTFAVERDDPHFEDLYRAAFLNYDQGRSFRLDAGGSEGTALAGAAEASSSARYRIRVRQAGPIRLGYATVSTTALVGEPLSTLRLRSQGVEVPLQVFDGDGDDQWDPVDWVQFWGQPLDEDGETRLNPATTATFDLYEARDFSDENAYQFDALAGARSRMASKDAAPTLTRVPPADFRDVARAEVDDLWRPLGGADPWYWKPTLAAGGSPKSRRDTVALPGLASTTAPLDVAVRVRGVSESATITPDHRARVTLRNGTNAILATADDDGSFDGREIYDFGLAWNYAGSGPTASNPLDVELEALAVVGVNNQVVLDRIEVGYRRSFLASSDRLVFEWPDGDAEFVVQGFSSPDITVYELTDRIAGGAVFGAERLTALQVTGAGPHTVRFRVDDDPAVPNGAPRRFAAFAAGTVSTPGGTDFELIADSGLRDPSIQADLIVVAHGSLLPSAALDNLLAWRASQGWTSRVVTIAQLQDEFNDSLSGPDAIRRFLAWVLSADGWAQPKPAAVLILGDGSYDYKGGTASGDYVPTQIMFKNEPEIGYYASDNLLAAVLGDDSDPDLMIGRLSVRSTAEANAVLTKIREYEAIPASGSWRGHALTISDRGKGYDVFEAEEFERINDLGLSFLKRPPHTTRHLRYWTDYGGVQAPTFRSEIKEAVNGIDGFADGAAMVQFVGHGNFDLWSDDVVLCGVNGTTFCPTDDTQDFVNGRRLPWLQVQNCLSGGFHTTAVKSMGESWLKRSGGGAIAVLAPSFLGFRYLGEVVTQSTWNAVYGPRKTRLLGTAALGGIHDLCAQGSIDGCQSYVLLGDPTTRLQIPEVDPPTAVSAVAGSGEVSLTWLPSATPGAKYDVWRAVGAAGPYAKVTAAPVSTSPYLDDSAVNTKTYYYTVVAIDTAGFESRWSNFNSDCASPSPTDCVTATPLNPNPPPPPAGLSVVDAESGGRLDVSWAPSPVDDLQRYTVRYGTTSGVYTSAVDAGKQTSVALTGLQNGVAYFVVVEATNTSGKTSAASSEASAKPSFVQGLKAPAFITDVRVAKSGSDVVLTWSPVTTDVYGKPETVAYYEVFRGTTAQFVPALENRVSPAGWNSSNWTDSGALGAGRPSYFYLVRAVDTEGNVGGLGRSLPDGISDLVVARSTLVAGDLRLSWSPVTRVVNDVAATSVSRYELFGAASPFTMEQLRDGLVPLLSTTTGTSIEVTPPAESRYYRVVAVDNRGNRSPY